MIRIEEIVLTGAWLGGAAPFGHKSKDKRGKNVEQVPATPEANPPGAAQEAKDATAKPIVLNQPPGLYAVFETTLGRIVCRLFPDKTPVTVQNFVELARGTKKWRDATEKEWQQRPYYNGLTFHRVIPKFMIQGGDYMGNGTGDVGYTFEDEFVAGLRFDKPGRLAMANRGPRTNGAQFFITVEPTPWLNDKHSIFGEIAEGQEVAQAICDTDRDVRDKPLKPVIMRRVEIIDTRAS